MSPPVLSIPSQQEKDRTQLYPFDGVALSDAPVLRILNLVLQTAFLGQNTKPISLLLIGKPGIGKSRLISPLLDLDFVSYTNDITPHYLVEFLNKVKNGERKFLAIPDFTNCMSHAKSTRNTLIATLRSMTEEGVTKLSDYHLEFESVDDSVRAGLITATTHSSYREFAKDWKKTGFLSRLLPFSFSHSQQTTNRIMNEIDSKQEDNLSGIKLKVTRKPKKVIYDSRLLRQLRTVEEYLSIQTQSFPYRHQIQLNKIAEASPVLRGDTAINQEDVDTVHDLANWINYSFKAL